MCGISGEVSFGGRPDAGAVVRMTEALQSRGPDGSGHWDDGWVMLGHRRLSIIDLSDNGHQPMVSDELGVGISFNGCVYNYRELRTELEGYGYGFHSNSDTEVVLVAYHRWGERFAEHLVGMFAVAVVDRTRRRLVLARDRLGIKPLYLAESGSGVRFASTLPALLAGGGVDTGIDTVALHHYLSWHSIVPAPRTILRGVRKLPPATVRVIERDGSSRDHIYWRPDYVRDPAHAGMDAGDWQEALTGALRVAVERRLIADVPVGVLLSGGLDSSLIVALTAEAGQRDLRTFSIGFDSAGGESGDEFAYSDLAARTFGTEHTRIPIEDVRLQSAVEQAVTAMSEPMGSHDVVAFHLLSQEVSRHVKVAQSGQGADEVFGGYGYHQPLARIPRGTAADAFIRAFADRSHAELAEVVQPEHLCRHDVSRAVIEQHLNAPGADTAVDAVLRLDTHLLMPDDPVKRVDNMSMAWGLELRVPFLDQDLVSLAAACPPELKVAQGGKGVLKDLARRHLPAELIDRPKGYFPVPALRHLQGAVLDQVTKALYSPAAKERGLFRPEYVEELLAQPNKHRTPVGYNKLWQLGLLELWLQSHGIG
ncbi:N-acetylglutaminylglutamine amidotransferase [Couchioplanes azureus]|uniref:N-acetylglutaminylglutamine amidotransferase n=1 Tax=Couchioplanes caeruleus TaxID=56438 RepID=UPI0016718163|nr:N-acetylglutaminylglutamine amidotransferase [Couchioplanes caeruleus]GGQ71497.1 asparagine synthetase B [Couchioplanes caeruleus subsp. azureus]